MKNLKFIFFFTFIFFLASCEKEAPTPLTADFDMETDSDGNIVPVTVTLNNKSEGATSYEWTFEEGNPATSNEKNPGAVVFNSIGEFTITLVASNDSESKTVSKKVTVNRSSEIVEFNDVSFGVEGSDQYGYFFSTKRNQMYKEEELNEEIGEDIDLALVSYQGHTMVFFESPTNEEYFDIPNARNTNVINFVQDEFTVEDFDAMEDDSSIKDIEIVHDGEAIFATNLPKVILFQNADMQKGVIKLKAFNSERLLVDIKLQKYPL